jgi:Fe-S-cluster containining protein
MGKASRRKRSGRQQAPGAPRGGRPGGGSNQGIAQMAQGNVVEIVNQGRGPAQALEIATSAFFLCEHLTRRFETENPLPQPVACKPGCEACCHNLVELTPPEALALGQHIRRYFSEAQKDRVLSRVAHNLALAAGQTKNALAARRRDLPCPLLQGQACLAYPVRPLVCRAMHGLSRERCEAELRSGSLAGSQYYAHRQEIALSVSAGLTEGCRAIGCQSGTLDLARGLHDFFNQENPAESWLAGTKVFASLPAYGATGSFR